ncbi:MAG: hypothetical protein ABI577_02030 [bacterium]
MDRQQKINQLIAKAEDIRRLAMDDLDAVARRTNTFGSKEHRSGRDKVERDFDQEQQRCERLEEQALDLELTRAL